MEFTRETEIRNLPVVIYQLLIQLLEGDDTILSLLMGNIPNDLNDPNSPLRFTSEQVDAIIKEAERSKRSPVMIFIDEWSTMGKSRPRIGHFIDILIKCDLYRAAEFLAEKIQPSARLDRPLQGPAARVDILLPEEIDNIVNGLDYPFSTLEANQDLTFKPSLNTPNMGFSEQSRVENASLPVVQPSTSAQSTRLIEFSRTIQLSAQPSEAFLPDIDALRLNSNLIPETVNSNVMQEYHNIPAFSGLFQNGNSENFDDNLPIMLRSLEINHQDATMSQIFNNGTSSQISDLTSKMQSSLSSSSSASS